MEGVLLIRKGAPAVRVMGWFLLTLERGFESHRCHHVKRYSFTHKDEELNAARRLISVMKVYGYFQVQYECDIS